ncbi:MAG: hypothetical protein Q9159_007317 [Coniocarpon cinnabarinum]
MNNPFENKGNIVDNPKSSTDSERSTHGVYKKQAAIERGGRRGRGHGDDSKDAPSKSSDINSDPFRDPSTSQGSNRNATRSQTANEAPQSSARATAGPSSDRKHRTLWQEIKSVFRESGGGRLGSSVFKRTRRLMKGKKGNEQERKQSADRGDAQTRAPVSDDTSDRRSDGSTEHSLRSALEMRPASMI